MGFWHTGYLEHHEEAGLGDYRFVPRPPEYRCAMCGAIFETKDALRGHRFETHPRYRPVLMLNGLELGTVTKRVTAPLRESDVEVTECDAAFLNGRRIPPKDLPGLIADLADGTTRLMLKNGDVVADFTLDVCLATEDDLTGIERELQRMVEARRLDVAAIDDFIVAAGQFGSAVGYCDGIAAYLYGMLAKEGTGGSSLLQTAYVGKYNQAVEALTDYDRPIARVVGSLIAFNFNQFSKARGLGGNARVGHAAGKYDERLNGAAHCDPGLTEVLSIDEVLSDSDTEQVVRWAVADLATLAERTQLMEHFVRRDTVDLDRFKVHVLLAEAYAFAGDKASSVRHAKSIRYIAPAHKWAERLVRGESDGEQR